jgi:choline dehydrogenase-like flavoprotein
MMGGNKMGMDPASSVVAPDYSVWGVGNLFIFDASIFPSSVGANPMQTIYTTAIIGAQRLLQRMF